MAYGLQVLTQRGMVSTENILSLKPLGSLSTILSWNGDATRSFTVNFNWSKFAAGTVLICATTRMDNSGLTYPSAADDSISEAGSTRPTSMRVRLESGSGQSNIPITIEVWGLEI